MKPLLQKYLIGEEPSREDAAADARYPGAGEKG